MKKVLLVTTISGFVPQFEMNSVYLLQKNGYEVHYATNYNYVFYGKDNSRLEGTGIICHQIDFARSPLSKQNYFAYKQLDKLMTNIRFDVIHCHTPVGGVIARLVGKKHNVSKVSYTAHGFHFYKGAPLKNWVIYYWIERLMARYTDALITINTEDYHRAQGFSVKKGGGIYYIPGAGIEVDSIKKIDVNRKEKRQQLGVKENDFIILSIGELNKNKNHEVVIRALSTIKNSRVKYLICGDGIYRQKLERIVEELGMQQSVKLLGYRSDIIEIEKVADVFAFPSYREGLSVALMEAMASGLPIIASKIRGNIDLIDPEKNGYLLSPQDVKQWKKCISYILKNTDCLEEMRLNNLEKIKKYDKKEIKKILEKVYEDQKII